jgi:hypothetical protein
MLYVFAHLRVLHTYMFFPLSILSYAQHAMAHLKIANC